MKKRLLKIFVGCMAAILLSGCEATSTTMKVNVENSSELNNIIIGITSLVKIGYCLYYDSATRIVYMWNGIDGTGSYAATMPSPYYAPNGLPYRYNPETNTFEEIQIKQ